MGGSGWGTLVHPWLICVNVWQKRPQYCKVISLQIKFKKNLKKRKVKEMVHSVKYKLFPQISMYPITK